MYSALNHDVRDRCNFQAGRSNFDKPFSIIPELQAIVEEPDAVKDGASDEHSTNTVTDLGPRKLMVDEAVPFRLQLIYPEILDSRDTKVVIGTHLQAGNLAFEFVLVPQVIGIEKSDIGTLRQSNSGIASCARTGIGLSDCPQLISVTRDHVRRAIGRAIVDDDQLNRPIGLAEDTVNRVRQIFFAVPHRNDAAYERLCCS